MGNRFAITVVGRIVDDLIVEHRMKRAEYGAIVYFQGCTTDRAHHNDSARRRPTLGAAKALFAMGVRQRRSTGGMTVFHPIEPIPMGIANGGYGAGRAVPNAKLSDREGSTPAVRSQTSDHHLAYRQYVGRTLVDLAPSRSAADPHRQR
jgi:hypothetical protein